jgi:hypothetical protein
MTPLVFLFAVCLCLYSCADPGAEQAVPALQTTLTTREYKELKKEITQNRKQFLYRYAAAADKTRLLAEIKNYWVATLGSDLYEQWKGTPWDFNGTTQTPRQGAIACGYFVTHLLQDMGCTLDRVKLSTCPSLTMMKSLAPEQPVLNLSRLSYAAFNERIKKAGRGVFIAGLDFHTGFLINDGTETWFLHSNYIGRQGVVKEKITASAALQASQSRFVILLTEDEAFLQRWMNN